MERPALSFEWSVKGATPADMKVLTKCLGARKMNMNVLLIPQTPDGAGLRRKFTWTIHDCDRFCDTTQVDQLRAMGLFKGFTQCSANEVCSFLVRPREIQHARHQSVPKMRRERAECRNLSHHVLINIEYLSSFALTRVKFVARDKAFQPQPDGSMRATVDLIFDGGPCGKRSDLTSVMLLLNYLYPRDWDISGKFNDKDDMVYPYWISAVPPEVKRITTPHDSLPINPNEPDIVYKRTPVLTGTDLLRNWHASGPEQHIDEDTLQCLSSRGYFTGVQPEGISVTLREDQLQTLQFMLDREIRTDYSHNAPLLNHLYAPVGDTDWYYSPTFDAFRRKRHVPDKFGGILGDEVGFGKTVEILSLILSNPPPAGSAGTLVVCTVSLVDQWVAEVKEKSSGKLNILKFYGPGRHKHNPERYDIVVTTYQTLAKEFSKATDEMSPTHRPKWWRVVLDESHTIGSSTTSQMFRACSCLEAQNRWCVTGTPMGHNFTDLLPGQLQFLGFYDMTERYIQEYGGEKMRRFLRTIMIRHYKTQKLVSTGRCLLDLPEVTTEMVKFTTSTMDVEYARRVAQALSYFSYWRNSGLINATQYNRAVQPMIESTSLAKIPHFVNWYHRTRDQRDDGVFKVVVFTEFVSVVDNLLKANFVNATVVSIAGNMTMSKRTKAMRTFEQATTSAVMVLSLRAASTGLNLMAASHVVFMEAFVKPKDRTQAIGRIHRMGQKHNPICAVNMVLEGTVDDVMHQVEDNWSMTTILHRVCAYLIASGGPCLVTSGAPC